MANTDSLLSTRIHFSYLNKKNGLPSDLPQAMLEDKDGNIWICFENYIGNTVRSGESLKRSSAYPAYGSADK